ncbi:hypothetical protein IKG20_00905, partial [Candidatus Saccharibacteria bacterium]|nr:hypothetical protein [Candidatus Saccharibacteria bacterium]
MEDNKKGKISGEAKTEAIAKDSSEPNKVGVTTKDSSEPSKTEDATKTSAPTSSKSSKTAIMMSSLALILGTSGLALGWVAFDKTNTPITFLGSGQDGNSANFTEGSIADIANKVAKSVVSIVT